MTTLSFAPAAVKPQSTDAWLLLTALRPISHHDPANQDDSNTLLFNREAKLLPLPSAPVAPLQSTVDTFCAAHPAPFEVADALTDLSFSEFVGACLTRLFLDIYNSGDGEGVFSGMERYSRLESRLRNAAVRSHTLRGFWDCLVNSLNVSIHPERYDRDLLEFFTLPKGLQALTLSALSTGYRSIAAIARLWNGQNKLTNADYASKANQAQVLGLHQVHFNAEDLPAISEGVTRVEVFEVSNNTLRHQVVRGPGWLHLCGALGIAAADPGFGELPPGAEAIFVNGGNIRSGAKQPTNPFGLAQKIRQAFPLLDLLGGTTDSFDVGESRLSVSGWLVCKENSRALINTPAAELPQLQMSAFDMSDSITSTRQATDQGVGQMIYSYETLATGVQVLVHLSLKPYCKSTTRGALAAAISTYIGNNPVIGGQIARGCGVLDVDAMQLWDTFANDESEYEIYLENHQDALREAMTDGTLGSGAKVVS